MGARGGSKITTFLTRFAMLLRGGGPGRQMERKWTKIVLK